MTKAVPSKRELKRQEREQAARDELDTASWAEAQRAAAKALDARQYALECLSGDFPHRVDEPLSELLVDIHRMTQCAVMIGAFGTAPVRGVRDTREWRALGVALNEDVRSPMDVILRETSGNGEKAISPEDRSAFASQMARWVDGGSKAIERMDWSEEPRDQGAFVSDIARIHALAECGAGYHWFGRLAAIAVSDVLGWILERLMRDETPAPFFDVAKTDNMRAILPETTRTKERSYIGACELVEKLKPSASSLDGIAMERGGAAILAVSLFGGDSMIGRSSPHWDGQWNYAEAMREAWSMALHPRGPKGRDKANGAIKAETSKAVRAALKILGDNPDAATSSIDKKNSRSNPHSQKAEARRNAAARARKKSK